MKVWTYWEGDVPPIIQLCFDTMSRHNQEFEVITPDKVKNHDGGLAMWNSVQGIPIPQRSDFIRLWWLYRHGGIWNDSDCIQTAPFDFDSAGDLTGVYNPHSKKGFGINGLIATPWACNRGSPVIERGVKLCRQLINQMKAGQKVPYGQTSVGIMSKLWKTRQGSDMVYRREHWKYNRVPWYHARQVFTRIAPSHIHERSPWWSPIAVNYHLTNVVPDKVKGLTREQIIRQGKSHNPFYSFLFQKALGLNPGIFGRTREVLSRLPTAGPIHGAEVGVFRGQNARHLLQQRSDIHLTLVDPWGQVPEIQHTYRSTKDFQATMGQIQWDNTFKFVGDTLGFAQGRFLRHRMTSSQAYDKVPDESLDFVFIDGNHSYPGVKTDLAWWNKVKPGGFVGGHDYNQPKNKTGVYGVNKAVHEFCKLINASNLETGIDWTWFVRKPTEPMTDELKTKVGNLRFTMDRATRREQVTITSKDVGVINASDLGL